MRILKNKIAQVQAFKDSQLLRPQKPEKSITKVQKQEPKASSPSKKRTRVPGVIFTPKNVRSTKNIVKNFGQAICRFILSDLASFYLTPYLEQEKTDMIRFRIYIKTTMKKLDSLFQFRSLLMIQDDDTEEIMACKRLFKIAGEIFIKVFSVNWIFHSKIQHKRAHLMFRFKMLRRIRSPELFTYLKASQADV